MIRFRETLFAWAKGEDGRFIGGALVIYGAVSAAIIGAFLTLGFAVRLFELAAG